jgi:hypothetical protein
MLAAPPWKLDFSSPRFFSNHRVRHGDERKLWINAIKSNLAQPNSVCVFVRGSKSNWNRDNDRLPTLSVASLFSGAQEVAHAERNIGFSATAFDADLVSLASAALQAQLFLNLHPTTPQITIYSTNPAAIQAITYRN